MHETVVSRPVLLVVDDELPILRVIGWLVARAPLRRQGYHVVSRSLTGVQPGTKEQGWP